MSEETIKVIRGHAESAAKQLEDATTFLNEISAISSYRDRGMVELKMQPILIELIRKISMLNVNINTILEETKTTENE